MTRRTIAFMTAMLASCFIQGPAAGAQRGERTRPSAPTKADYVFADLSCEVRVFNRSPLLTTAVLAEKGGIGIGEAIYGVAIPNGASTIWDGWKPVVFAVVVVTNKGTRAATFETQIKAWKPPNAWRFIDPKSGVALAASATTISATIEAGTTSALPYEFYLKPTPGRNVFAVEAITDIAGTVREPDETNNVCRSELNLSDVTGQ
jgi:hypothetical protein